MVITLAFIDLGKEKNTTLYYLFFGIEKGFNLLMSTFFKELGSFVLLVFIANYT
jgi:hypothetical protein